MLHRSKIFYLLLVSLASTVLLRGGVDGIWQLALQGVGLVAMLAMVRNRRHEELSFPYLSLSLLWILLLVLQCLPLPLGLIEWLSPFRAQLGYDIQAIMPAASQQLSLDRGQTLHSLMLAITYLQLFYAASWVFENEDHRNRFGTFIVSLGTLLAVGGIVARQLGYKTGFATFINDNQAAIFMALILPFTLTQFMLCKGRQRRFFYGLAVIFQVVAGCLLLSRFGLLAMLGAVGLNLLYFMAIRVRLKAPLKPVLWLLLLTMGYLAWVVGFAAIKKEASSITPTQLTQSYRWQLWQDSLTAWQQAPLLGFGAGTFEQILPSFRSFQGYLRAEHAESEWLEILVTTGALGFCLLLLALSMLGKRLWLLAGHKDPLQMAVLVALLLVIPAMGVHFIFEVPAITMLIMLLLGMIAPLGNAKVVLAQELRRHRLVVWLLPLGLLLAWGTHGYIYWQDRPCIESQSTGASLESLAISLERVDCLEQRLKCHPAKDTLYRAYAHAMQQSGLEFDLDRNYLQMAVRLNSFDPANHDALARVYERGAEYVLAQQHYQRAIDLTQNVYAPDITKVYQRLIRMQLKNGQEEGAEGNLQTFAAQGGSRTQVAALRLEHYLHLGDYRQLATWLPQLQESNPSRLQAWMAQINGSNKLNTDEKQSLVNLMLLSQADLGMSLQVASGYLALPARLIFDRQMELAHIKGDAALVQLSRFDNELQDWLYTLDVKNEVATVADDIWGVRVDYQITPQAIAAGMTLEVLVKSKRKPGKQLEAVLHSDIGDELLRNTQVIAIGQGWYALVLPLKELLPVDGHSRTLQSIGYNSANISGKHLLSSFRIYNRSLPVTR